MIRHLFSLIVITGLLAVAACNTVAGAGKDVSGVGDAVTDTATEVKNKL